MDNLGRLLRTAPPVVQQASPALKTMTDFAIFHTAKHNMYTAENPLGDRNIRGFRKLPIRGPGVHLSHTRYLGYDDSIRLFIEEKATRREMGRGV